ncbi:MAG: Yip1 family protein [Pyrinomonadaceae bacterium]
MENPTSTEWQAPPPPEQIAPAEQAQMSEAATLGNIFFEPGRTFEDLRRKPRFILAAVIMALLFTAYLIGLATKVGDDGMRRFIAEQIDKSPQAAALSPEQKSNAIDLQMTIGKYSRFATPVVIFITFLVGGLLYWAAAKAFGGSGGFLHALSVWIYSGLPPMVVAMIANFIVLIFKSADDIDLALAQRGLVNANPSFFIDGRASPVLSTLLSAFDLFAIWGWILAAIGLRITNRLSSGAAWAAVLLVALIGITLRVVFALISGNPM